MTVWFCLASGPSLTPDDVDAVRGRGTVLAINDTIKLAPWADVHYACDVRWWQTYARLPEVQTFGGKRVCLKCPGMEPPDGVEPQEWRDGAGLGTEIIHTGSNSGYQAINYAYLQGARTIVLLGYDMQLTDGKTHHHGDHPAGLNNPNARTLANWVPKFRKLAQDLRDRGVRVINCTRATALRCFAQMPLERALDELDLPAGSP